MTIIKFSLAILSAIPVLAPATAASYLPVGPQLHVAVSTVIGGGWRQCFADTMDNPFGISAATTLTGCNGSKLLVAGRETGASVFLVLAQANKADVLFNTGANRNNIHVANGTGWYNADNYSFGFAPEGEVVDKFQCDIEAGNGRFCLHTDSGVGGYRFNDLYVSDGTHEKVFYTNSVPEPASWAMLIAGFGLVGAAARRRRSAPFVG